MKVLITGAGMVGTYTAAELVGRGDTVTLVDLRPDPDYVRRVAGPDVRTRTVDVRELPDLVAAIGEAAPDVVLHTVAILSGVAQASPYRGFQINVVGTIVSAPAASLERLDLGEAGLPEPQHVLRQFEILGNLADRPKGVRALVHDGSRQAYLSSSATCSPLIRAFRTFEGLNTMTRRGSIGTSIPVFGLRPMRCPLSRTTKDPNEDSLTVSPRARQSQISARTDSTRPAGG